MFFRHTKNSKGHKTKEMSLNFFYDMDDISKVLWPLEFFVCLKKVIFDLHQEEVLCYTQLRMDNSDKTHC